MIWNKDNGADLGIESCVSRQTFTGGGGIATHATSESLRRAPSTSAGLVLVDPTLVSDASNRVGEEKDKILASSLEGNDHG